MANKKGDKQDDEQEVVQINKWDGSQVKHAVDDAFKNALMERPNCKEHFSIIDGRLFICALAVGVALFALGYDYIYTFPTSKPILIICVASYFVLMGILTIYTTYVEKGIFAVAIQSDGSGKTIRKWTASSEMKKYDDKYTLTLSVKDNKNVREVSTTKSCANFVDELGVVCIDLVATELKRLYNSLNNAEKKDK